MHKLTKLRLKEIFIDRKYDEIFLYAGAFAYDEKMKNKNNFEITKKHFFFLLKNTFASYLQVLIT